MRIYTIEERESWRWWVTPKLLEEKPIHRWYFFPHSFSGELVHALIDEWNLGPDDCLFDPFAGAGTTLLAAKAKGIPATGYDLSPLSVFASRVKIANHNLMSLENTWRRFTGTLNLHQWDEPVRDYPELVRKALHGELLKAFDALDRGIERLIESEGERDFFRLALLSTIPRYSRAVATGGWLKWRDKPAELSTLLTSFSERVELMLKDVRQTNFPNHSSGEAMDSQWHIGQADARTLPDAPSVYSAVITSPPYPNRHDYTRVFGVELMFAFLDWEETRRLRYQSFHSHPEAKPNRSTINGHYHPPISLVKDLIQIRERTSDLRVPAMLEGYFLDMYLCLSEIKRVCRDDAKIAMIVGNAQYCGEPILVDELTAEIGEQAGLVCEKLLAVRSRGNSAQQMGKYGRNPSRESVVIFRKPPER